MTPGVTPTTTTNQMHSERSPAGSRLSNPKTLSGRRKIEILEEKRNSFELSRQKKREQLLALREKNREILKKLKKEIFGEEENVLICRNNRLSHSLEVYQAGNTNFAELCNVGCLADQESKKRSAARKERTLEVAARLRAKNLLENK